MSDDDAKFVAVLLRLGPDGKAKRLPAEGYRKDGDDLVLYDDGDEETARFAAGAWLGAYRLAEQHSIEVPVGPVRQVYQEAPSGETVLVGGVDDKDGRAEIRLLAAALEDLRFRARTQGSKCWCLYREGGAAAQHQELCPFYGEVPV